MPAFAIEPFLLLSISLVMVFIRTAARLLSVGFRDLQIDDYFMLIAAAFYSGETGIAYKVGATWKGLGNNGMTDAERAGLDLNSHEAYLRRGGSKNQLIGWSFYSVVLWSLKICMNGYYSRMTTKIPHLELRVKIGWCIIASTWIATICTVLFSCRPLYKTWQIYPDPGNQCQPAVNRYACYVFLILNISSDLWLLSIPMPMFWKAKITLKRKLALTAVFGGGVFVMMAGILRCVLLLTDPVVGASNSGVWAVRESFVAMFVSNVPVVYPIISNALKGAKGQGSSSNGASWHNSKGSHAHHKVYELNGNITATKSSRVPWNSRSSVHSLATDDSRERIVDNSVTFKEEGIFRTVETEVKISDGPSPNPNGGRDDFGRRIKGNSFEV